MPIHGKTTAKHSIQNAVHSLNIYIFALKADIGVFILKPFDPLDMQKANI